MTVQIFGFRNDQDTRKAQRFFAERRIPVHFVDLDERPASPGELRRFAERFGAAALIDRDGPRFRALGLRVAGDSPERCLARALTEPRLLRTPLVRNGSQLTIGHAPDTWRAWHEAKVSAP
jgi:arsenate reductase-like glutaredoxin family protein